jgi:hypothetical protein
MLCIDTALVAVVSAVPPLAALGWLGPVVTPDTPTYVAYAEALRNLPLPSGQSLFDQGPLPVTLYRTPGLPALLVALQAVFPSAWMEMLIALQIAAQVMVAAVAHRAGLALGLPRAMAAFAALAPAVGFAVVAQISVMTDALYSALISLAAFALLFSALGTGAARLVVLAGILIGIATLIREATVFLALAFVPAALLALPSRRWAAAPILLGPAFLAAIAIIAINYPRAGVPMLSATRQIVMVQALLPLVKRDVPVFDSEEPFDVAARRFVVSRGYDGIMPMLESLHAESGMRAPDLSSAATDRYWRAWRNHPLEMLRAMMVRFPIRFLAAPFQPLDTAEQAARYAGVQPPDITRIDVQWRRLRSGDPMGGIWLTLTGVTRAIGMTIGILSMIAPVLLCRRRDPRCWPILGLWLICAGFVAVYLPVHIELRYLIPIVPLTSLMAATVLVSLKSPVGAPQ